MAEFALTPRSPLDGYRRDFATARLAERTGFSLLSLAIPRGGEALARSTLETVCGCTPPPPGQSVPTGAGDRIIWSAPDQLFAVLAPRGDGETARAMTAMKAAFYVTDQSDNWAMLGLAGRGARAALERICPLDLHDTRFPVNAAARTVMHHMGAFLVREGEEDWLLMSAASMAHSFLHAVELSLLWTS